MAGLALWNAWLYEALAEATDREILVLNLDAMEGYESALSGVERHHLIYNPTTAPRSFRLIFKHLPEADYLVSLGPEVKRLPAAALQKGLSLTLKPGAHSRITVQHGAVRERQQRLEQRTAAENALAHAYQLLQERAVARGASSLAPQEIATFTEALSACRDGRHVDAEAKAKGICNRLLQDTALR
jgi:hypothetical protein